MILKSGTLIDLIFLVGLTACLFYFWNMASKGKYRRIREIPGLKALEEAIGRGTEMGRPIHFALGDKADIKGIYATQIIAGLNILQHIAKICARLGTGLICTLGGEGGSGAEVLPLMEEIIQDAYKSEGKEEEFIKENIRYISGDRDTWAMGAIGIFYKEKPVSNIMIGPWAGTSLHLLEVAARLGMIQIGGTARTAMMPVMATICDYFFIGEEIFAASALVTEEPIIISTLTAQDLIKGIIVGVIIAGVLSRLAGSLWIEQILSM